MLRAITAVAEMLLSSQDYNAVITPALALLGPVAGVDRILLSPFLSISGSQTEMQTAHEWCAPGLLHLENETALSESEFRKACPPKLQARLEAGKPIFFYAAQTDDGLRQRLIEWGLLSNLVACREQGLPATAAATEGVPVTCSL